MYTNEGEFLGNCLLITRSILGCCCILAAPIALHQVIQEHKKGREGALKYSIQMFAMLASIMMALYEGLRIIEWAKNCKKDYASKKQEATADYSQECLNLYNISKVVYQLAYTFIILGYLVLVLVITELNANTKKSSGDKIFKSRATKYTLFAVMGLYVVLSVGGLVVRYIMGKAFVSSAVDGLYVGMLTIAALKEAKTLVSLNYHSAKAAGLSDEAKAARRASAVPMLRCIGVNLFCALGLLTRKILERLMHTKYFPYLYLMTLIIKRVVMLPPVLYLIYWAHESRGSGQSPLAQLSNAANAVGRGVAGGACAVGRGVAGGASRCGGCCRWGVEDKGLKRRGAATVNHCHRALASGR